MVSMHQLKRQQYRWSWLSSHNNTQRRGHIEGDGVNVNLERCTAFRISQVIRTTMSSLSGHHRVQRRFMLWQRQEEAMLAATV